jgi:hypothetical protein
MAEFNPRELPHEKLARLRADPAWRQETNAIAKKIAEDATTAGTLEEKVVEASTMQAVRAGLPVSFHNGNGNNEVTGRTTAPLVHGATAQEVENYANAAVRTCGMCKNFRLREGRQEIARQNFLPRLLLEEGFQMKHLGAPPDHLGICGAKPSMVTSTVADAGSCPGYQHNGRLFR